MSVFGTLDTPDEWESDTVEEVVIDESKFVSVEARITPSIITILDVSNSNEDWDPYSVEEVDIDASQSVPVECKTEGKWLSQLA